MTPDRRAKLPPLFGDWRVVPVANRRDPRAPRSALTSDAAARAGGACLPTGATREWSWLIPAEAPRRLDGLEFVEIEVVDRLQRLGGGAVLKAFGQGLEPGPIFGLKGEQDSDGIMPASDPTAAVAGTPVMGYRCAHGAGGAISGLALGIAQGPVAEGLAGHCGQFRSVT